MPSSAGDNEKEYLVNLVKKKEMLKVLQQYKTQLCYRHSSHLSMVQFCQKIPKILSLLKKWNCAMLGAFSFFAQNYTKNEWDRVAGLANL